MSTELSQIYLAMIQEAINRLKASEFYFNSYQEYSWHPNLEAATLQLRKALEAIALASIAPNQKEYERFRSAAEKQPDFRKDYHAGKILKCLDQINKDFFPLALTPAVMGLNGVLHFDQKCGDVLTKKRFESIYDQLGKHLHANNPWGNKKHHEQLVTDLPSFINEAFELLELHATFIRTTDLAYVWIVEAKRDGANPNIIRAYAAGDFVIENSQNTRV